MLPTAPIPVHTAYAVPNGSERSASAINVKLRTIATTVAAVGQNRVNPSEYLRPSAQPTSSKPAPSNASHALTMPPETKAANQWVQFCHARYERGENEPALAGLLSKIFDILHAVFARHACDKRSSTLPAS